MIDLSSFLDDVLNTDVFGQVGVWTPTGGNAKAVKGVFENDFLAITGGIGEVGVSSSTPSFICKTADTEDVVRGGTLYVNDVTYYIQEVRPDGEGFTVLILSRDA